MTLGNDKVGVRRKRAAALSGSFAAGALVLALCAAAAAPAHAGWGSLVATSAAPGPLRTADVRTADGGIDALPPLGTACIRDGSGHDVVVMGRMSDTTVFTRLVVTFSGDAPITVTYGVSQDGAAYRTVLDADYRDDASRADDYVISLAVDAMKVYPDVCSR